MSSRGKANSRALSASGQPTRTKTGEAPARRAETLADHEELSHAVEGFVRANSNFESSVVISSVVDEINRCEGYAAVFATPLKHKLFSMDTALRWVLFLAVAPARAAQEGGSLFSGPEFSAQEALALLASVYDIGVQAAVWEHFEEDVESEEEEEGEA